MSVRPPPKNDPFGFGIIKEALMQIAPDSCFEMGCFGPVVIAIAVLAAAHSLSHPTKNSPSPASPAKVASTIPHKPTQQQNGYRVAQRPGTDFSPR